MADIRIVKTKPEHLRELARTIRKEDKREIEAFGYTANVALWRSYKGSVICKSIFVQNELAAIFGVGGETLDDAGKIWFLTTSAAEKVSPLRFARIYQEQVLKMLKTFKRLENYVDYSYTSSIRILELVGFTVHDPEPMGEKGNLFCKYTMRMA